MSIRVLHVIDSGGVYGAEAMLLNLVHEQIKAGLCPQILSVGTPDIDEKPLESEARRRGLPVRKYRMKAGLNIRKGWEIIRKARQENFDLIHSHGYKFNILFGILPKWLRKIPIITTVHGYTHARILSKMWVYQIFDRLGLMGLDCVVFVSEATSRKVRLRRGKIAVVANGIDVAEVNDADIEVSDAVVERCLASCGFVIGAFGRLAGEKGFEYLLTAFKGVLQAQPNSCLIIWGEGYLRKSLEELVEYEGLEGRVVLPGYTEHVEHYLRRIDVLAMPSLTEGLPISLLQAMKHKVPVVASEVGAIPEILDNGRCGDLVPPRDKSALLKALLNVHDDADKARKKAMLAYERFVHCYSSEMMSAHYAVLYKQILIK